MADTLLEGIEYRPVGWDPVNKFFAFLGPSFGEMCYAPLQSFGTELMSLMIKGEPVTANQLTSEVVQIMACPAFSTPTPTPDLDEGENATATPAVPQCSDGLDNDRDGLTDLRDPQCRNANDNDELNP